MALHAKVLPKSACCRLKYGGHAEKAKQAGSKPRSRFGILFCVPHRVGAQVDIPTVGGLLLTWEFPSSHHMGLGLICSFGGSTSNPPAVELFRGPPCHEITAFAPLHRTKLSGDGGDPHSALPLMEPTKALGRGPTWMLR